MGNCGGTPDADIKEQQTKDKAIRDQLKEDSKEDEKEIKLLLLGAGESGKSTIFKQMKIIHNKSYSQEECNKCRDIIYSNLLLGIRILCIQADKMGNELESPENKDRQERLISLPEQQIVTGSSSLLTPDMWEDLRALSTDKAIRETWLRKAEFQINDSVGYYMDAIDRLSAPSYSPSQQDVLRSRVKTVGIVETRFEIQGAKFKLVDVGGQRNERRKWIHVFDDVTAIIFVVGLSEYDQKLFEDESMNRMQESVMLFNETANCKHFKSTSIIIFFNKKDLFAEKIQKVDLKVAFPEYTGGCNYDDALTFIKDQFTKKNQSGSRQIYTHTTCATETKQIEVVFNAVTNIILNDNLRAANII